MPFNKHVINFISPAIFLHITKTKYMSSACMNEYGCLVFWFPLIPIYIHQIIGYLQCIDFIFSSEKKIIVNFTFCS